MRKLHIVLIAMAMLSSIKIIHGAPPVFLVEQLAEAPANTPKLIATEESGGRDSPATFWIPGLERVGYVGGTRAQDKDKKFHYPVELYDPATGTWRNSYPKGAPYTVEYGGTDAPHLSLDSRKELAVKDAQAFPCLPALPEYAGDRDPAYHQYAFDPDTRKLYLTMRNSLLTLDLNDGDVKITEAERFNKGDFLIWGAFAFDPINKEVVSIGGTSREKGGTPGTWLLNTETLSWKRAEVSSPAIDAVSNAAEESRVALWALLNRARSRFFITESPEEAQTKLGPIAQRELARLGVLQNSIKAAALPTRMNAAREHALLRLANALKQLAELQTPLDGAIDAELLAKLLTAYRDVDGVKRALAAEPDGRIYSPMAWDPQNKRLLLFGGSGQDRCYADTWLYDPATRTWEQRFPERTPEPRSAHVLGWLTESKRMVMAGGYNPHNNALPFEVWSYDIAANRWECHVQAPGRATDPKIGPAPYTNLRVTGTAVPGDYLLFFDKHEYRKPERRTWGVRVDTKAVAQGKDGVAPGVPSGTITYNVGPADFERDAVIDPAAMQAFYDGLVPNVWTHLPAPKRMSPTRDYGTTRYDPVRKQFLWWGGGHVNYWGAEINHYSVRTGQWTASGPAEHNYEPCGGFAIKTAITFRNAPQIPVHAYQAYDVDIPSGLVLFNTRGATFTYDLLTRTWDWLDDASPKIGGAAIRSTPEGAIACGRQGDAARFYRFSAKSRQWEALPTPIGDTPRVVGYGYGDYDGFCPDPKRGLLWIFHRQGVWSYDIATGASKKVRDSISKAEVSNYLRDSVYLPELDRIMMLSREKNSENYQSFWNPEKLEWERAVFTAVKDGKDVNPIFSTNHGLMHDPDTGLLFVNGGRYGMYVMKLDSKTVKLEPIPSL